MVLRVSELRKLKWLMLATHVPASGSGGGMVRYVVELARALNVHPDVEFHVLANREAESFWREELGAPTAVHVLPRLPRIGNSLIERIGLTPALRGADYDIVHGPKHLIPHWTSAATILTVHDMILFDRPDDFTLVKRSVLGRPYLGSVRDADAIACVSRATRDRLVEMVPGAGPKSRIIPHAVPSALVGITPEPVQSLLGRTFVLVVGDPSPRKNLSLLVSIWPRITRAVPGTVLAIAGPPGWGTQTYGPGFEELEAGGAVQVLGHLSDSELAWAYANCSLVACPSLAEGAGIPALEAEAFGAPLITSLDPALVEMSTGYARHRDVRDGNGWTADLIEGLSVVRSQRAAPSNRTWDDVAGEHVGLARDAMSRSSGGGSTHPQ